MRYVLPLVCFAGLVFLLALGLRIDPTIVPSALIGKPVPDFVGQALDDQEKQLTRQDLIGKPAILSFWATWCPTCLEEHTFLRDFADEISIPIYGVNYKDDRKLANEWLLEKGNPYTLSIYDGDGRIGLEWGVYAVPELFVIDKDGIIRQRFIWPVDKDTLRTVVLSLIRDA